MKFMKNKNTQNDLFTHLTTTVRPQDDLFRYVNGTWLDNTEIPADQASAGAFIDLYNETEIKVKTIIEELAQDNTDTPNDEAQKIGDLYASFMNEKLISEKGTTPLDTDFSLIDTASNKAELTIALAKLAASGVGVPFEFTIDANQNDPDNYIVWLAQSGLGLPDEAFYRAPEYVEILTAYKEFIPRLYALGTNCDMDVAQQAMLDIVDFETKLAAKHLNVVELRDTKKTNNVMTWDEFLTYAPEFNWAEAFACYGLTRDKAPELLVYTPNALAGFAKLWAESSLDQIATYLKWHIILSRAPYLSKEIVAKNFAFYGRTLAGSLELRDRWKRGVSLVDGMLGEALGKEYVKRYFPPSHKAQMEQLVADLLAAYRDSITALDWMSESTKTRALEKLDQFVTKIGYPDKWKDYTKLEIVADDLVGNIRRANEFELQREIAKLGKPVDRSEWHMYPQTINAYYNPVANEIVFPAAILQPPFFDPDADLALNYGGIGSVIGHEIGHGFDDQGSQYDGKGQLNNWWTSRDLAEFKKRTQALVAQYDAHVPAQFPADSPHHVQGALTLGENIGDLGGISIALKAYAIAMKRAGYASVKDVPKIAGFTGVQRVLLSYAHIWQEKRRDELMLQRIATDPHSPAEFRCNGVMKNVDAFAEEFNVREGDELYLPPTERVRIW